MERLPGPFEYHEQYWNLIEFFMDRLNITEEQQAALRTRVHEKLKTLPQWMKNNDVLNTIHGEMNDFVAQLKGAS